MELTGEQQKNLQELTQQYELNFLALFGSHARGQTHAGSDLDIGYHARKGSLTFEKEQRMQYEIEQVMKQEVDLRSFHSENPYFLQSALNAAQLLAGDKTAFSRARAYAFQVFHDAQYDLEPIRQAFLKKRLKLLQK